MFMKVMKLHYKLVCDLFIASVVTVMLWILLTLRNFPDIFGLIYRTTPLMIVLFLGINRLFGSLDFGDEAVLMQMLPIRKKTCLTVKLMMTSLWITVSFTAMALVGYVSCRLAYRGIDPLQDLMTVMTETGMSRMQAGTLIATFPGVVFLLVCFVCLTVAAVQLLGNVMGSKRKKVSGIMMLTLIGILAASAMIWAVYAVAVSIMKTAPPTSAFPAAVCAAGIIAAADCMLYLGISRLLKEKYEVG